MPTHCSWVGSPGLGRAIEITMPVCSSFALLQSERPSPAVLLSSRQGSEQGLDDGLFPVTLSIFHQRDKVQ
jgi:hypothetical protein